MGQLNPADHQARLALLREGMQSYPEAMRAISEFRAMLLKYAHSVARPRREQIAKTLAVPASAVQFKDFKDGADDFSADHLTTNLGVEVRTAGRDENLYCCVGWEAHKGAQPIVWAGIYLPTRALYQEVVEGLRSKYGNRIEDEPESYGCYVLENIALSETGLIEEKLGAVLDSFLKMLEAVDARAILKPSKRG